MSASYQELNLDELGFLGRGKSKHRPRNDPILYGGDFPFIQTGDVKAANLHIREYRKTYNETGLAQSKLWDKGTLLITIAANIAETAILDIKACFPDSVVGFVPDKTKVNSYFVKYYIDYIKREMQSISQGTTQDNLSLDKIRTFKLRIPEKKIIDEITNVLLTYDKLIENNNRRIAILEDMAQSIYREWFVKFRFPGHEDIKLIDSPLGEIPEGWEVKPVGELLEFDIGGGWGKEAPDEKHTEPGYVIRGTDLQDVWQGDIDSVSFRYHTKSNIRNRRLNENDIIFEASGGSKGQPVGRTGIVTKELLKHIGRDLICASFCKIVRAKSTELSYLLLNHIRYIYENGHIMKYQVQSTGISNFKFKVFLESELMVVPDAGIRADFLEKIEKFTDMCQKLAFANHNLKKQRDLLLPKLISGNIKIGNV